MSKPVKWPVRTGTLWLLASAAMLAGMFAGCGGNSPESAANTYLNDLKLFNYPACYQMLSHQDQLDRTIDDFLKQIPLAPDVTPDWFKSILHATDYQVGQATMNGDKAIVPIKVTRPDLALWERTIDAQLGPNDTADSVAQKQLTESTYPKVTYDDNMVLVKQGNDWRLLVDYPEKDKIASMHKDAIEAYHKHDYDKAAQAYQGVLAELDKNPATGNDGLKFLYGRELADVQAAQKEIPDAQAYVPKIVLSDVDMKMSASRVPGIFGKMTNSGDKAIDEVQFTVTYYEGKGKKKKEVFSEVHIPVATPLEFTDFSRPALPFVPGETRTFGFRLTAPADIQTKATPDLNVTSLVFTQSTAPLPKPATPTPEASPSAEASAGAGASAAASPAGAGATAPAAVPSEAPLPPPPPASH